MGKAKMLEFLDEARTVLREQPGLDSNALLDRLEEKGYTTPFLSTTEKKQIAEKKANEDAANLAQDLKEKSDFALRQTLETGPESTASAIAPPKVSREQIQRMIVSDEIGGKPDKKEGEYKFGIGGFVKMSTSFDPNGNLSSVKGNNYQAMAKTLLNAGVKSIGVEGSPLRAYRMFKASVENGLNVSNVSITKSFPVTERSWSYDPNKSPLDNREALQKAFSFIPAGQLDILINQLEENRKNMGIDPKNTMTPTPTTEPKAESTTTPETEIEQKKDVELVSDIKVTSVSDLLEHQTAMEDMQRQTGKEFEISVNEEGKLTVKGEDVNVMSSYLAGQKATNITGFPEGQNPSVEVKNQLENNAKEKGEENVDENLKTNVSGMQPH